MRESFAFPFRDITVDLPPQVDGDVREACTKTRLRIGHALNFWIVQCDVVAVGIMSP
jgi:hypothetical protein